eukprot:m.125837 g.125837  ORF g.125837 m.125837 type:complete len:73 (-) comp9696_c0_seq3:122-340(-)
MITIDCAKPCSSSLQARTLRASSPTAPLACATHLLCLCCWIKASLTFAGRKLVARLQKENRICAEALTKLPK